MATINNKKLNFNIFCEKSIGSTFDSQNLPLNHNFHGCLIWKLKCALKNSALFILMLELLANLLFLSAKNGRLLQSKTLNCQNNFILKFSEENICKIEFK
jgi:hypothetical protein